MPDEAVVRTITVLVIACPHALGLAIPLVVSIATERAARAGVLVKDRLALESMRTVDTVLFDKTGTLTKGAPAVTGIETVDGCRADQLLALAAAAEADSEHPLARAIVRTASDRGLTPPGPATSRRRRPSGSRARSRTARFRSAGRTCSSGRAAGTARRRRVAPRGSDHPARRRRRRGRRRTAARRRDPPRIA